MRQSGVFIKSSSTPSLRRTDFSTELIDQSVGSSTVPLPGGPQQSQSPRLQRPVLPPVWKQQNRIYQSMPPNDGLSPSGSSGYQHGLSGFATRPGRYSASVHSNDGLSTSSSSGYHHGTSGFATRPGRFSVRGGKGTGNDGDGWGLRQFHACKPLDP